MNTLRLTLAGLLLGTLPAYLNADPPTPDFLRSQVQAHLRIDVDKETDTVHFISTDNDPYIHTKTYVLKHADPYEIRPYLREAVGRSGSAPARARSSASSTTTARACSSSRPRTTASRSARAR